MVPGKRMFWLGLAIFAHVINASPGLAQAKNNDAAKKPTVAAPVTAVPATPAPPAAAVPGNDVATVKTTGFRSAKFGMTEAEVRVAIRADFGVSDADIRSTQNLAERTQALSVKVPDVLQDSGIADVSYILGYKTKKLIQVSVLWSKASDPSMTAERLLANAETLRDFFIAAGYQPQTILTNVSTPEGVLFFRGNDAEKHVTVLLLRGTSTPGDDKQPKNFTPAATVLFYLADAQAPDIFKIQPGKF